MVATLATRPTIQQPKPEWFAPITPLEAKFIAEDPAYAAFNYVARYVGAWATAHETERRRYFIVETSATIFVPVRDDLPDTADGEAKCLEGTEEIHFDFRATLVGIADGFAQYAVILPKPYREYRA